MGSAPTNLALCPQSTSGLEFIGFVRLIGFTGFIRFVGFIGFTGFLIVYRVYRVYGVYRNPRICEVFGGSGLRPDALRAPLTL